MQNTSEAQAAPLSVHDAPRRLQPSRVAVFVILLALLIFFGLVRYRLRDMPLERDEGEYAYSGQLMLEGIPPYQLAYNMKLPGIYAAYAAIMAVLGETPTGIHLGLLLLNAATIVVMYFLAARLFGRLAGVIAACSYAVLSASSSVMGFQAHATNFVVLPALIGVLLLLRGMDSNNAWALFVGGVSSGIAVLMKQHGIFFVLFCMLYLWFEPARGSKEARFTARRIAIYVAGVAVPYAITCLWLLKAGVFPQFWFWTVSYAGEYSKMGLRRGIHAFLENSSTVVAPAIAIWILAAIGFSAICWSAGARRYSRLMALLLLCSFLSTCPGVFFRPHYFVLVLPVIAILVGVAVSAAEEWLAAKPKLLRFRFVPIAIFMLALASTVFAQRRDYFVRSPLQVLESTYPNDPFEATMAVADYVKANSMDADRIAVLGSEPEIYFYARRRSATGHIYMYGLIVRHKYTATMREQFERELEKNRPEFLVYVDVRNSWGEREGAVQAAPFLDWMRQFMSAGYERVGMADLASTTNYAWGNAAATYVPRSSNVIYVLRRVPSASTQ